MSIELNTTMEDMKKHLTLYLKTTHSEENLSAARLFSQEYYHQKSKVPDFLSCTSLYFVVEKKLSATVISIKRNRLINLFIY